MKDLVLVGAGHAHLEVLRRFARRPLPGVQITLVTRMQLTPYSGMLPGLIAGAYRFSDAHIDVGALARVAGARLVLAEATGLDASRGQVFCRDDAVRFDAVSLNIGSRPDTASVPGAARHALAAKPIEAFLTGFAGVLRRVQSGRSRRVVMAGGGAGGVELMLAVAQRLRREAACLHFTLVAGPAGILPGFPAGFRARLRAALDKAGISVRTGPKVAAVDGDGVLLADGRRVDAEEVLWATEAAPAARLAMCGLPADERGFVRVDGCLQAAPGVFAAGDMVAFGPGGLARSGVQAVRAGPVLAANLRAHLMGGPLRQFRPGAAALTTIGTGGGSAVATRNGWSAGGRWAWWLKDGIDRRYMARFRCGPTG